MKHERFFQAVYKVTKCPTDDLSLTNCAIVNDGDLPGAKYVFLALLPTQQINNWNFRHIRVHTGGGQNFIFSIKPHSSMPRYNVGFSLPQRKWAVLSLNQEITVEPYHPEEYVSSIILETDYMQKKTYDL